MFGCGGENSKLIFYTAPEWDEILVLIVWKKIVKINLLQSLYS